MDYNRIAGSVIRQLRDKGRPVTLRQYSASGGDYNPGTGRATPVESVPIDSTRYALTMDQPGSQLSQRFGQNRSGATLVEQGEKWVYMEADGPAPSLQDHVIFDDVDYTIFDVQVCKPGLVALFYLLILRV